MPLLRVKLEDRFFIVTGIEIDELEFCTRELNLENDAEYIKMMKENNSFQISVMRNEVANVKSSNRLLSDSVSDLQAENSRFTL